MAKGKGRLSLFLGAALTLVFSVGMSAPASAEAGEIIFHDPKCELGAPAELREFSIEPTDSWLAYSISGIKGNGLACGTEVVMWDDGTITGEETLYREAPIKTAPKVDINRTAAMTQGAYVGYACVDVIAIIADSWVLQVDGKTVEEDPGTCAPSVLSVDNTAIGTMCPSDAVACYKGISTFAGAPIGHNWNWATVDAKGKYTLTIGEFFNDLSIGDPAGLTEIENFTLCDRAGGTDFPPEPKDPDAWCGSSGDAPWVQMNGHSPFQLPLQGTELDTSREDIGVFSASAVQFSGKETTTAFTRVKWACNLRAYPESRCLRR